MKDLLFWVYPTQKLFKEVEIISVRPVIGLEAAVCVAPFCKLYK